MTEPLIRLSAEAAVKIQAEALAANEPAQLRVGIEGGGCSGFRYVLAFTDTLEADDQVWEQHGVRVVVDPISLQYLAGATVEYQLDLGGERIVIRNPNAHQTCSCGSSFA